MIRLRDAADRYARRTQAPEVQNTGKANLHRKINLIHGTFIDSSAALFEFSEIPHYRAIE